MNYKIKHKFGIFIYDQKTGDTSVKWFKVGQVITKNTFDQLSNGTKRHCEKINTKKRKTAKKK